MAFEMTAKTKRKHDPSKLGYKPTARERTTLEAFHAHKSANPAPRLKVSKTEGKIDISPDHPKDAIGYLLLMEAFGTMDADFVNGLIIQVVNAGSQGQQVDEQKLNFMLSIIKGVKPTDQVEAMLAAQMAAVHPHFPRLIHWRRSALR